MSAMRATTARRTGRPSKVNADLRSPAAELLEEWTLDLLNWWDDKVSVRLQTGRGKMRADMRSFISMTEAETKIKQQQVRAGLR
jgi:hypothetical protein